MSYLNHRISLEFNFKIVITGLTATLVEGVGETLLSSFPQITQIA